jgi:hypothetical protein
LEGGTAPALIGSPGEPKVSVQEPDLDHKSGLEVLRKKLKYTFECTPCLKIGDDIRDSDYECLLVRSMLVSA